MSYKPEIRKMEFIFTRIHFEGLFSNGATQRIKDFLLKSEDKFIGEGRFKWAFGNIDSQSINGDEIIFGRLGRTITQKFGTIYDQSKHSYRKELIKSSEAAYSNFFIIPSLNILVLEEKYNLSRNKFIKIFKEFWKKQDAAEIGFEFIKDEIEIFEIIKTWDRITEASFDLVPSNPSSRDNWKPVDEIIREASAKRAKLKFENKEDSLSKENSIVQQSMSMSADGYGEFRLKGFKDNVGQVFNSISKIIKKEIHSVDDLKAIVGQIHKEVITIVRGNNHNE
jgi:hypothetical protein